MDAVGEAIVQKLVLNLKGAAATEETRRIVAEEVVSFIKTNQGVEEEDVAYLEERIRHRLASPSGLSGRAEKLGPKQTVMQSDDWSKVALYVAYMAKEEAKRKAAEELKKKENNRTVLEAQLAETAQRVQEEKVQKKEEHVQQEKELEDWRRAEAGRKQERVQAVDKLKLERQAQLEEQARRKEISAALKKKGEEEMTVRIALEMKKQIEAEEAAKAKAKEDLKAFLLSNEANQQIKAAERQKEFQDDIRYMKEFTESLERQERARLAHVERTKAIQERQAEDAKQRPPIKKWVDPAIIERQFQEKQAALAEDDARRKARVAERTQEFKAGVAAQLQEKERVRLEQLEAQRKELERAMEELELSKKLEKEAKQKELQKMQQFKATLDQQIAEDKAKRELSTMSETERKLNSKLLQAAEQAMAKGAIRAVRACL